MSIETFRPMKYGPIGEAVMSAEPHTEADPVGIYASILSLWSSAINGCVMMGNGRPIVVWTVLVGESALGRKGTALGVALGMLQPAIGNWLESRTEGGVSSGPSLTQLLYDYQEETRGSEGGIDTRMVVVDVEWSENLKRQSRCPTFASKLRQCWDGTTIRHVTTKTSMTVEAPRLGLHTHITPGEWAEYVKPRDAKGGSFNRLLPVMVEGSKVLPYNHREVFPDIPGLAEAYEWARRSPRRMSLSKEAGQRYDELRVQFLEKMADMPSHLCCYIQRTPEQIVRVAAVLTATECQTVISRVAIDAAWSFVQYSMRSVERLVREDTKVSAKPVKNLPTLIRETLARHGGEATSSLLLRSLGLRGDADSVKAAAEAMEDVALVKGKTSTGRGRPPTVYRLVTSPPVEPAAEVKPTPEAVPVQETPELTLSGSWL